MGVAHRAKMSSAAAERGFQSSAGATSIGIGQRPMKAEGLAGRTINAQPRHYDPEQLNCIFIKYQKQSRIPDIQHITKPSYKKQRS